MLILPQPSLVLLPPLSSQSPVENALTLALQTWTRWALYISITNTSILPTEHSLASTGAYKIRVKRVQPTLPQLTEWLRN
jgi:hypothetical protein